VLTRFIGRPIGSPRAIPVTATSGHGSALSPRVVGLYREGGMPPPPQLLPDRKPEVRGTRREYVCDLHGNIPGDRCLSGCHRAFVHPIEVPLTAADLRREQRTPSILDLDISRAAPRPPGGSLALPDRDARGRFVPDLCTVHPDDELEDELMPELLVRSELRKLLSHLPRGTKKPLARACGYRGKWALHTLRGVAKGRGLLPDACRRRISRVLNAIQRGELILVQVGPPNPRPGRPSRDWVRRSAASERRQVAFQH
jgi:hypothetical protein